MFRNVTRVTETLVDHSSKGDREKVLSAIE